MQGFQNFETGILPTKLTSFHAVQRLERSMHNEEGFSPHAANTVLSD